MSILALLLCFQLWSLQNVVPSLVTTTSRVSHGPIPHSTPGVNKSDRGMKSDLVDITENNKVMDIHTDKSGMNGSIELVESTWNDDEMDGDDLQTYDPITDTFTSAGDSIDKKGTRRLVTTKGVNLSKNGRRVVNADHINNLFTNSYNESVSDSGVRRNSVRNYYFNVYDIYCPVKCRCEGTKVDCAGQNLTTVPKGISPYTTWLDLSMNGLQKLPENTFVHLTNLKELQCVGNNLTDLPQRLFRHNKFLQLLNFQGNNFSRVPPRAFQNLSYLLELHLDANGITTISRNTFVGLINLKQLWLDDNKLLHVPASAFRELTGLQALTLIKNEITHLPDYAFQNNTRLIQLRLGNNAIKNIAEQAFYGLSKLKYLQLQENQIQTIPSSLSHLVSLEELNLEDNLLAEIPDRSFQMKNKLTTILLGNNPIKFVAHRAFTNLPSLNELILSEVRDMTKFPDLTGTNNLTVLQLDRANIKSMPVDLCALLKQLKSFDVHSNKIGTIPVLTKCKNLTNLNMGNNQLTSIDGHLFFGMDQLKDLTLSINYIDTITEDTFVGLSALEYLNLADNQISEIHPNAFLPLKSLKDLNLGDNKIPHLPTAGLVSLEKLKIFHNSELREFPPKEEFPNVDNFVLSYAYHCCDFILSRPEQIYLDMIREHVVWMDAGGPGQMAMWERYENDSQLWEIMTENMSVDRDHFDILGRHEYDNVPAPAATSYLEDYQNSAYSHNYFIAKAAISCKPKPGPFMPCDDLFGWWSLRCGVWFVFMLALLGNGAVFFVSVTSKSKMDVPRFLICNLALADFFMGIYLAILAIMDASTLGHFKKYAIEWQMSAGCLVAGTLGVLSSELSVFTLTVITLERFYAITHAMQLNKRLSLKHAGFIMLCGWIWSFGLSVLPLFGISDYRKFAVCLPFEIEDPISKSYVCFIMVFNGISFFIILSCYLIMYISIRDSQAWNSNDTRVAKRMALLVFTDFLCWAPIAFLSLAAAFGKNLIELNEAKVLTIFILPLNSCANPFLYAFFTKQFKRDCVLLCRRLEDSFLARHFSQTTQRHVSLSWKNQRRPSALHSLMEESKSNNSQNNSSGSNSYGLLNFNSEISSGTNKTASKEVIKSDLYITQATTCSASSSSGEANKGRRYYKHTHNYKPCPSNANEDDNIVKNSYADDIIDDDDNDNDQMILHQDLYSQRGPGRQRCMDETCVDEEQEHNFIHSSQKSYADFSTVDINIKANDRLHFPSRVVDENISIDKDDAHLWVKRSVQHSGIKLQGRSQHREDVSDDDREQAVYGLCVEKWQVSNNIYKNEKQINIETQNSQNVSQDKGSMINCCATDNAKEEMSEQLLEKCPIVNTVCSNEKSKEKSEKISDTLIRSQCDNECILITNVCKGKDFKSNRDSPSCPVEQRNSLAAYNIPETNLTESDDRAKYKSPANQEYIMYMPPEIQNDQINMNHKHKKSDSNGVSTKAEDHLDNLHSNVILLKNEHTDKINSPSHQHKVTNLPASPSLECFAKQGFIPASPANYCCNTNKVLQIGQKSKQLNSYQQQFHKTSCHKSTSVLSDFCLACDKHILTNVAPNNWAHITSSPVPVFVDSVLIPGLLHQQKVVDKNINLQYFQRSTTGCETLSKSNSLADLTQAYVEETKAPLLSSTKCRSLTLNQDSCKQLNGEARKCVLQSLHHPYSSYVSHPDTCDDGHKSHHKFSQF